MKKLIVVFLIISTVLSCKKEESISDNTYEINVSSKGVYNGVRAYLKLVSNNSRAQTVTDTAIVVNETFTFKGNIDNTSMRLLTINGVSSSLPIILESGVTNIEIYKDSIFASKVNGQKNNTAFSIYKSELRKKNTALNELRGKMNSARLENNNVLFEQLSQQNISLIQEGEAYPYEFILENPKLDFSLLLLENLASGIQQVDIDKFKECMQSLTSVINKNDYNRSVAIKLNIFIQNKENEAKVDIGKVAPNFTGTTPEGNTISLNDIKGKVTIIDFWAAWCAPCRKENPNVVKVYEKYHDKGLEIISVSLDGRAGQNNPKTAWVKAIENDKLNWHHISSLTYFNEPAARLYSINAIPATFILDENGVIVSKRLRGDALDQKIGELLK
ncbi:DUF4369 domain-containing protein [Flavobacteriaceae bacterium AU392]|nr:AhpC/TSA family protein [Flavobacteriaceae bacterium]RKM86018.1 DUF4369 domain-containing protein [Flavobacteriaceae bacterium AU392]